MVFGVSSRVVGWEALTMDSLAGCLSDSHSRLDQAQRLFGTRNSPNRRARSNDLGIRHVCVHCCSGY